jgi:fructose-1,6-bisphosphatase II
MGIKDIEKVLKLDELAHGDVMFAATGVTTGDFLRGVRYFGGGAKTHSVVMRSKSGTVRYLETNHHFNRKPNYGW